MAQQGRTTATKGKSSTTKKKTGAGAKSTAQRKTNANTAKSSSKSRATQGRRTSAQSAQSAKNDTQNWAIILFAISVFLLAVACIKADAAWLAMHNFVKGSLGICAFVFPFLLMYIAILTAMERQAKSKSRKLWLIAVFTVVLSSSFYIFNANIYEKDASYLRTIGILYREGEDGKVTGALSGIFGYPLYKIFGLTGSKIIISILLCVLFMIITGITLKTIIGVVSRPVKAVKENINRHMIAEDEYEDYDDDYDEDYTENVNGRKKQFASDYDIDVPLDSGVRTDAEGLTAEKFNKITKQSKKSAKRSSKKDNIIDIELDDDDAPSDEMEQKQATDEKIAQLQKLLRDNNLENLPDYQIASVIAAEVTRRKSLESKSDPMQKQPDPQTVPVENIEYNARIKSVPIEKPVQEDTKEDYSEYEDNNVITSEYDDGYTEEQSDTNSYEYIDDDTSDYNDNIENESDAEYDGIQTVRADFTAPQSITHKKEATYKYPYLGLLHPPEPTDDFSNSSELSENGQKLIDTLKSFGVAARIVDIARGPSITRYEIQPAPGVKISKITNLSDDIALNLAASGVRIEAPIPGKAAVGIEIPNRIVSIVTIRELIASKEFKNAKSKLSVVLGKDISGDIVVTDLSKMPHLLIAGTTGSGKSVCVNSILLSLLFRATPQEVKILLIDPKMVEFSKYKGIPHLLVPVVSDAKKAAGALNWAVSEMLKRYQLFAEYGVRDIIGYNKLVEQNLEKACSQVDENGEIAEIYPNEKLPQIVIAIDELADLMMAAPNEVEEAICRLAQMARAAGMHLVIATQRPSVNVITGVIKANIPSRIALKVSSQIDSRTILDVGGAEKLIGRGDMLFSPVGQAKPLRVQGGYASDEEIENVTEFLKKSQTSEYDEEVIEQIEQITAQNIGGKEDKRTSDSEGSDDPMMEEAIKVVVEAGQASTSLLQRRLRLGYARAGRLIDEMEQMGIVGPHEGSKSRQVLMSHQEWLERSNSIH
ncbi:MAG: DNA translocase FtsK [Acutalibacteraceae bacterium]